VTTCKGRQVRYALADAYLARTLGELVQVMLAVDSLACRDDRRDGDRERAGGGR
jgi:hypothetical protein